MNWDSVLSNSDPSSAFENFHHTFRSIFNKFFLERMKMKSNKTLNKPKAKPNASNEWYTPELSRLRKLVICSNDRYKTAADLVTREHFYKLYLHAKRIYKSEVDLAKKNFNAKFIETSLNPCKAAWSLINGSTKKVVSSKCPVSPDTFNTFLLESVEKIVDAIPDRKPANDILPFHVPEVPLFMNWKKISATQVMKIVNNFKNSHC